MKPVGAGAVTETPHGHAEYGGVLFRRFQTCPVIVSAVLGEFYWRVTRDQLTRNSDYRGTGKDSANTVFNAFDARLAETLQRSSEEAAAGLSGRQPGLVVAAVLALLGGLGVALLARSGVATRLKEYR